MNLRVVQFFLFMVGEAHCLLHEYFHEKDSKKLGRSEKEKDPRDANYREQVLLKDGEQDSIGVESRSNHAHLAVIKDLW